MQKISSIIPSSRRVTSVDMKDAHPVRPGVPQFGRPMAIASSSINKSSIAAPVMSEARTAEEQNKMDIVNRVSDGFFMQKQIKAEESLPSLNESPLDLMAFEALAPSLHEADEQLLYQVEQQESEGEIPEFVRPGRYLDVTV